MRARYADWNVFEPAARTYIETFIAERGRPPFSRELIGTDGRWILHSAKLHHGGFTNVLRRLGFTPAPRDKKITRRSDWAKFSADAEPVLARLVAHLGRVPTQIELHQDGSGWLVSAAAVHHGGLISVYERLGFDVGGKKGWADWEYFSVRAKAAMTKAAATLGYTPSCTDLRPLGFSWVATAAYTYHDGYDALRQKLGFPPPPHKLRGRGLANWSEFIKKFRPVVEQFIAEHGTPPSTGQLIQMGHRDLLFAARNHFGGYVKVMRKIGLALPEKHLVHLHPKWSSRSRQYSALATHYPKLIAMGIMPTTTQIRKPCPGLYAYWNRSRKGWAAIAKTFGLVPAKEGQTYLTYWHSVHEALDFYEANGRWPRVAEMTPSLRLLYSRYKGWTGFFLSANVTRQMLDGLIERHRRHYRWLDRNQPDHANAYNRMVNRIVMARNNLSSPTHVAKT